MLSLHILRYVNMSKQVSSNTSKVPAIAPTSQQVMSQEELRRLHAPDGSSSSNLKVPSSTKQEDEDDGNKKTTH